MPAKDPAREAAFAAMQAVRDDIVSVCREIQDQSSSGSDTQITRERLTALLGRHGFEANSGVAGLSDAFRATRLHHDEEAMRNGLQHGHIAILVPIGEEATEPYVGSALGLAAALVAAIGIGATLESEFGTLTVLGYPDDASLVALARAGVFEEFDVAIGARPASGGDGYCYTIDSTGDTLAARTATVELDGDIATFVAVMADEGALLEGLNRIDIISSRVGRVDLSLTGQTSIDLRDLSALVQRHVDETPGASVSFGSATDDMIVNRIVARRIKTYADTLGHTMDKIRKTEPGPATGWGNVSQIVPAFLLNFPFTSEPVVRGESGFAEVAAQEASVARALAYAECVCMAGLDILRDMQFRSIADDQLVKALAKRGISRQHRRWLGVHPVIKPKDVAAKKGKKGPKLTDFKMVRGPGMRDN